MAHRCLSLFLLLLVSAVSVFAHERSRKPSAQAKVRARPRLRALPRKSRRDKSEIHDPKVGARYGLWRKDRGVHHRKVLHDGTGRSPAAV